MPHEEIRELIKLFSETSLTELEVQRGDFRVHMKQSPGTETGAILPSLSVEASGTAPAAETLIPPTGPETPGEHASPAPKPKATDSLVYVKSPIVGTFYESASPGNPPFVRIGEHVTPGKVLCIIESMKLMNEIEADAAGIVESKLVENGQPVEYGEALFGIRPV